MCDKSSTTMDARATSAKIISTVITDKRALDLVIQKQITASSNNVDNAFARELCYGVMRWYHQLEECILDTLIHKPIKAKDADIKALILSGMYQLDHLRTPAHAAVSATINASKTLNKPWAGQMINAILRRYQREHVNEISASWGVETEYGRQTLPGQDGTDGFYYSVLVKK